MAVLIRGYLHHHSDRACIDHENLKYERFARKAIINGRAPLRVAHNKAPGATFAWADLNEDRYGAKFECSIPNRSNSHALARMIREGTDGISMSFRGISKRDDGAVTVIERARLIEVSIVPRGAYDSARCWIAGDPHSPETQELAEQWERNEQSSDLTAAQMMGKREASERQFIPQSPERTNPIRFAVRAHIGAYLARSPR